MGKTPASIGLPMLVVVFMSICLFSFSGISYSIARSSLKVSDQVEKRVLDYQNACNQAEEELAALEEIPEGQTTISVPFGVAMENLEVTIEPDETGKGYRIIRWQVAETSGWEAPDSLSEGADLSEGDSMAGPQGPVAPGGE
ncbi:hypothetical protein SAMN06296386_104317 [Lachnospiraceae bacterium]|nr:hypothetical protein SAMN06296386_104317 [Lachnospiraceae bacterium]